MDGMAEEPGGVKTYSNTMDLELQVCKPAKVSHTAGSNQVEHSALLYSNLFKKSLVLDRKNTTNFRREDG